MKTFINESSELRKNPAHDKMKENIFYFLKTLGFFATDSYSLADINKDGINDTEMFTFEKSGIKVFVGVTSSLNGGIFYTVFIRMNDNQYPLEPTTFDTITGVENTLTKILTDLEDKNKLVDLGIEEPGEPKKYNKSKVSPELANQAKEYMNKFVNENMKLVITETQYKKLQKHLKQNQLKEASLGKKVGMAALGGALSFGSPQAKGQEYVNPNYQSTNVSRNDEVVIKNGRKLEYILSQIHNNYDANDEKLAVQPTLDSIKNAIKKHLEINAVISEDVFREFIERIKSGKSKYGVKQFNGKTILIWKEED